MTSEHTRPDLVHCPSDAESIELPHRCPATSELTPVRYELGPRGRARLGEGETVPASARCPRCGGRAFASLVDPDARARRPPPVPREPAEPRRPLDLRSRRVERMRLLPGSTPPPREPAAVLKLEPCPACGAVPDAFGLCRCSA